MLQGDYDEAASWFKRALTLDPASLWVNLFSPMVPLYGKNPEDAVEIIKSAQHFFPGEALLTSWEGLLWAKRGEPRKADQSIYRFCRKLAGRHPWRVGMSSGAGLP